MPMKKPKKRKIKTRVVWTRSPIQKPHSTKLGKKGYNRKDKNKTEDEDIVE